MFQSVKCLITDFLSTNYNKISALTSYATIRHSLIIVTSDRSLLKLQYKIYQIVTIIYNCIKIVYPAFF